MEAAFILIKLETNIGYIKLRQQNTAITTGDGDPGQAGETGQRDSPQVIR